MPWIMTTDGKFSLDEFVRTATKRVGRVTDILAEYAPHEAGYGFDWEDEPAHHVYVVEFIDTWGESFTENWPEDFLDSASLLDAVADR